MLLNSPLLLWPTPDLLLLELILRKECFSTVPLEQVWHVSCLQPTPTGKTLLARAVANRTDATFIRVIGSELVRVLYRLIFHIALNRFANMAFSMIFFAGAEVRWRRRQDGSRALSNGPGKESLHYLF